MFSGNRVKSVHGIGCAVVVLGAFSVVSNARADLSTNVFTIDVVSDLGTGSWSVDQSEGSWDPTTGTFTWGLDGPITIYDDATGTIELAYLTDADLLYIEDPQVNLIFSVAAGGSATTFTVTSALLSFPAVSPATGQASAGLTLTDTDGNGASLTANGPTGGAYLAQYNGMVPTGTMFAEMLASFSASAFSTSTSSSTTGFLPIGVPVTDMSAQFTFTLSANDLASGTSEWQVIPAPGVIALLGIAGLIAPRRRRD